MPNIIPSIGRIVWFKSKDKTAMGNSATEVPAIITRVWSNTCVNLTVFRDFDAPLSVTSVTMADDFEASGQHAAWRWMPYQKAVAAGMQAPTLHAAAPPKPGAQGPTVG